MSICSSGPDTSGINAAAQQNAEIAKEALDWYKQEYARTAPQRDAAAEKANEVTDAQLALMKQQGQIAGDYNDYNKATFRPLEQQIVGDATAYDTPARRAAAAEAAAGDVASAFDANRAAMERNQASMGVNPNSGRMAALDRQAGVLQAAASAGAQNQARQQVETQGYARRMDAANLGRNLPSAQAVAAQTGTQAGNSAVGASGQALAAGTSGAQLMGQGFQTAIQGNQTAGQLYGQAANIQGQYGQADLSGLANLGMAGKYMFSSRRMKKGTGKHANTSRMLKAVESTPVHEGWQYDPAKGGPDDGGATHTGPMAEDVQKNMGDEVAPGGQVIDMPAMQGRMMGAVQELSKRVKKLEGRAK